MHCMHACDAEQRRLPHKFAFARGLALRTVEADSHLSSEAGLRTVPLRCVSMPALQCLRVLAAIDLASLLRDKHPRHGSSYTS